MMDNAADSEMLSDFLYAKPQNTQVALTTRDATLFADLFPQVALDVFAQKEAIEFLRAPLCGPRPHRCS